MSKKRITPKRVGIAAGVGLAGIGAYTLIDGLVGFNPEKEIMQVDGTYYEVECHDYQEITATGKRDESANLVEEFTDINAPSGMSDEAAHTIVTFVLDAQNGHDKGPFNQEQYFLPESCDISEFDQ